MTTLLSISARIAYWDDMALQNELHAQLRDSAARDRALQGRIFDLETALAAAQEKAQNTSIRLAQEEAKTHSLMAQVLTSLGQSPENSFLPCIRDSPCKVLEGPAAAKGVDVFE